jgi:ActR/RegA family two-component response regulator
MADKALTGKKMEGHILILVNFHSCCFCGDLSRCFRISERTFLIRTATARHKRLLSVFRTEKFATMCLTLISSNGLEKISILKKRSVEGRFLYREESRSISDSTVSHFLCAAAAAAAIATDLLFLFW